MGVMEIDKSIKHQTGPGEILMKKRINEVFTHNHFLIILQSCCSLNVKEVSHSQLVYPLVTQTAPPSLYYYGTHEGYDYFSILFTKYKVLGSNMNDQFRFDFTSWNKTHRMEMHVHMLELIPQTIYESEVYHKNSRPVLEEKSKKCNYY